MRTFEKMNTDGGAKCGICGTQEDGEIVLIAIDITPKDGAALSDQFHLKCLNLVFDKKHGVIYQVLVK